MGLLFKKHKTGAAGLLGIEPGPEGIALAHIRRQPDHSAQLRVCEYREAEPRRQAEVLKAAVAEHGLQGCRVNLVLHPAEYRTFLLEAPQVPADELRDAMRWRIKDMLDVPLDSVALDCFLLPDDAYRGRTRMAYCMALSRARMDECAELVRQAGLSLASIDITEMALRNLGLLLNAEGNIALLRLRSSEGLICIQNGADLYMARHIERGLTRAAVDLAGMTLEIQRSLDYFESQLGKGYLGRLILLPLKRDSERTSQALASGLTVKLQRLDLRELFPGQPAAELAETQQAHCLAAVGAALRDESI